MQQKILQDIKKILIYREFKINFYNFFPYIYLFVIN